MTIDECREYLPDGWTELIQQDPVLPEPGGAGELTEGSAQYELSKLWKTHGVWPDDAG